MNHKNIKNLYKKYDVMKDEYIRTWKYEDFLGTLDLLARLLKLQNVNWVYDQDYLDAYFFERISEDGFRKL